MVLLNMKRKKRIMRFAILVFSVICFVLPANSGFFAQDHLNVEHIGWVNSYWSRAYDVTTQGDLAFVATGSSGLQIMDISNPTHPEVIGYYAVSRKGVRDLAVSGGLAFLAMGDLHIVDVSNPKRPELMSIVDSPDRVSCVSVSGGYVYVGHRNRGLSMVDISTPEKPKEVGFVAGLEDITDVDISGNLIFVLTESGGLHIIEYSELDTPEEIGSIQIADNRDSRAIVVEDNVAFIADYSRGLYVVNVEDSSNPNIVGQLAGHFSDVEIEGDYAYAVESHWLTPDAIRIIRITDPARPVLAGFWEIEGPGSGISISGKNAFVTFENRSYTGKTTPGLKVYNIADWSEYEVIGSYHPMGWADQVEVDNEFAYLFAGEGGFSIVDFSSPETPEQVGVFNKGWLIRNGATSGQHVYLANYHGMDDGSLSVVDVSYPGNLTDMFGGVGGEPVAIAVSDHYTYVSNHHNGFDTFDNSDPENMTWLNRHYLGERASDMLVSGGYIYIADAEGNLSILDLSNPEDAILVGSCETPGFARSIDVQGQVAYIADGEEGLCIVDVSNPNLPETLSFFDTPGEAMGVAVSGEHALISDNLGGLRVINVSDPEVPYEMGYYNTPGYALDVAVSGRFAFVATGINLSIYDCSEAMGIPVIATTYDLMSAYPSPFNSSTTISYELPFPGNVSLQLYNPLGQRISTLFEGNRQAGVYTSNLVAKNLVSGLYFVRLEAAGQEYTRKIILVR